MAMLQQVERVTVTGFGALPISDNDMEFQPSQDSRELVKGMKRTDGGFITKERHGAVLEGTIVHRPGIDAQVLNAMTDVMVTVKLTNGETHVMPEACITEAAKYGKEGKFSIKFESAESRQR